MKCPSDLELTEFAIEECNGILIDLNDQNETNSMEHSTLKTVLENIRIEISIWINFA